MTTQGTIWTDADYAARGWGRVSLRLRQADLERLAALAAEWGCSRAEAVARLVRGDSGKSTRRRKK